MGRDAHHRERAKYGRTHHEEGNPVNVNVRVRRINAPSPPGARDVWAVLKELHRTGRVRAGYEIALVEWQAYRERSGTFSGWRRGDVEDLRPLLGPLLTGERTVHVGWAPHRRRVKLPAHPQPWARPRKANGRFASAAYARHYPHLVHFAPGEMVEDYEEVLDYEAEVRVDYEP